MLIDGNYIFVSAKEKPGYRGMDDYGRHVVVKTIKKKDILDGRLEYLKDICSDFVVSFFRLIDNNDKTKFALFMEPCLISLELFFIYKSELRTTMIAENFKEVFRTHEQARELSQDCTDIAMDIIKGVAFLHECGHFHGNLTPSNVLLKRGPRRWHAKIELNLSSSQGSERWRSVEILTGTNRSPTRSYSFSLGLILFFLFSGGHHAYFGKSSNAIENEIRANRSVRYHLLSGDLKKGYIQVVCSLLTERTRPAGSQNFPFFWSPEKSIQFLIEVVDTLNEEPGFNRGFADSVLTCLDWWSKMGTDMKNFFKDTEYYPGEGQPVTSYDLLRFVRNTTTHYRSSQDRCPNFRLQRRIFPTKEVARRLFPS
ncbi:hypothetical protein KPL71_011254 [Citrus sinensis]|uniref:Uncharacterized protein n=1 Tax=Citrus sinensis TaxID=2711 RepID=A0ACB8L1S2_CITSI|nr:hypothetical protein KPL71_011254 [Citrus sinensis]